MSVKFYTFRFLVKRRGLLVIPVCLPTTQRNISKRFTCDDNNFVCMVYGQYGQTQIVTSLHSYVVMTFQRIRIFNGT